MRERAHITNEIGNRILDIQHIGSTAVPGIIAKPILDIAVAIEDFESGYELVPALTDIGYTWLGENGIPRRHYFTQEGAVHLHIFEHGSLDWQRHIIFRDRLLSSPELAENYSKTKLAAAKQANGNRERYQELKATFIQEHQK